MFRYSVCSAGDWGLGSSVFFVRCFVLVRVRVSGSYYTSREKGIYRCLRKREAIGQVAKVVARLKGCNSLYAFDDVTALQIHALEIINQEEYIILSGRILYFLSNWSVT